MMPVEGGTVIVDIGWNGRMQRSIVGVLGLPELQSATVYGLYLGILRAPPGNCGSYRAWLFDLRSEPRPYCASHFQLYETLFAAPHATTYGYERDSAGKVVPTLAPHDALAPVWPELDAFHRKVLWISAGVRTGPGELAGAESQIRLLCRNLLAIMWRAPRADQAMVFSSIGFSSDQTSVGKERLIYKLSWSQQYRCLLDRNYRISANQWREGQLALADAPFLRSAYGVHAFFRLWAHHELEWRSALGNIKRHVKRWF